MRLLHAAIASLAVAQAAAGRVAVTIATQLAVPPLEARAAWLDFAWARGGGLPGTAMLLDDDLQARTLLPVFLKERLVPVDDESALGYEVTDAGPALFDVVAGSHSACVTFRPSDEGTEMVWDVAFDTTARRAFWEAFTRASVGEVSANLAASVQREVVFTLSARLVAAPSDAADAWLQCLADGDLGVPMPPPIVLDEGNADRAGYERLILPPGLRERVTSVERSEAFAKCDYEVVNPSWLTCYPAHTHRGEVSFQAAADADGRPTSRMTWRVCVRPQRLGGWAVRLLTDLIVPAFARNLAAGLGDAADADVTSEWS